MAIFRERKILLKISKTLSLLNCYGIDQIHSMCQFFIISISMSLSMARVGWTIWWGWSVAAAPLLCISDLSFKSEIFQIYYQKMVAQGRLNHMAGLVSSCTEPPFCKAFLARVDTGH